MSDYLGRKALMVSDIYLKICLLLPNSTIMRSKLDLRDKSATRGLLGCFLKRTEKKQEPNLL